MNTVRARFKRRARQTASDSGVSLMELVVSMSIFVIVLSVFIAALISMSRTTVRSQDTVDASDALRSTFNYMDRQVRYASAMNFPGQGSSGAWYVEFEATDLPDNAPDLCYQWRFDPEEQTTAFRTWSQDGSSDVSDWRPVAWGVSATGGGTPFVVEPAAGSVLRQTLTVSLSVEGLTTGEVAEQSNTFVARNSSYASQGNADANGDGVSDDPVCMTEMDRP